MLRSMTSFARTECATRWGALVWEIRSVNHRYLEINCKLPEALRALESSAREKIQQKLARGKVEVMLYWRETHAESQLTLNTPLIQQILRLNQQMSQLIEVNPQPLRQIDLLRWPGAIVANTVDIAAIQEQAATQLESALQQLVTMREAEGQRIQEMLQPRLQLMQDYLQTIQQRRPRVLELQKEKIQQKLAELELRLSEERLAQEVVILAQKMDIEEEIDRLYSHISEFSQTLQRSEPVGRRLDFLLQEFNREANTISSKSVDSETTQAAVELKVLIEQLREQIQNVE